MSPSQAKTSDSPFAAQIQWAQQNSRIVLLIGTVVLGTILAVFLFVRTNQIKAERAEVAYGQAQQLLYTGGRDAGLAKLREVATRYAGTNPGTVAAFKLALMRLEEDKPGEAINVLQEALPKANEKVFGASFHGLLGAAWSDSGEFILAADEYAKAARSTRLDNERADYNYKAAEMYALAKNNARALEILSHVTEGPASETRAKARKLAGELTVAPAKAG